MSIAVSRTPPWLFLQDGEVGVGVFPERQEILVGSKCLERGWRRRLRLVKLSLAVAPDDAAGVGGKRLQAHLSVLIRLVGHCDFLNCRSPHLSDNGNVEL